MKLLFIENRYTTYIWDLVARNLEREGHDIYWIVQNKAFTPKTGKKYFLPYEIPALSAAQKNWNRNVLKIKSIERGMRFFGLDGDSHIDYHYKCIEEYISEINPDMAFGECTLYHELCALHIMRDLNKPYLFLASSRFPLGKVCFFLYDQLITFGRSGDTMSDAEASVMLHAIINRELPPLSLIHPENKIGWNHVLADKLKIIFQRWKGERYNTPGLVKKSSLLRTRKKNRAAWEDLALHTVPSKKKFILLYAMHMQPEANVDVWAYQLSDQKQFLQKLLDHTPEDVEIWVKPNPYSHLELDHEMRTLVRSQSRLIPLSHDIKMQQVIGQVDMVAALTGTIALECIFANKPVVTFVKTFFNEAANCPFLSSFEELPEYIQKVVNNKFPQLSETERMAFLQKLNAVSFYGNTDGSLNKKDAVYAAENIKRLTAAFNVILKYSAAHWGSL